MDRKRKPVRAYKGISLRGARSADGSRRFPCGQALRGGSNQKTERCGHQGGRNVLAAAGLPPRVKRSKNANRSKHPPRLSEKLGPTGFGFSRSKRRLNIPPSLCPTVS